MNNENGARGARDTADIDPRMQPAMPLRRPHATAANNKRDADEDFGQTSKASVKSGSSGERNNRFQDKPKQPFKPRNYKQDNDSDTAQTTQHEYPKNESFNKPRNSYNRTPQRPFRETQNDVNEAKQPEQPAPQPKQPEQPALQPKQPEQSPPQPKFNLVPKTSAEPISKPEAIKPQEHPASPKESVTPAMFKPASVSDVTPTTKLIPKNYLMEKLSIGDAVILSVEAKASECRTPRGDYVCLTMAESFETQYQSLCEDFVLDCDKDEHPCKLVPGETCSYFNPEDGGWYRARCLTPNILALLDSGKLVTVTATDKCRKLPSKYEAIPEFCAVLTSKAVKVGANLSCKIVSQSNDTFMVSMVDIESSDSVGEGEVFRWLPTVEYPPTPAGIPEVERPPITDGSRVLLVLATSLDRAFVRPSTADSQRKYNDVLQQVLLSAMNAKPLSEPPQKGQMVIGKFTDGNHYRALVRRTNVKQNKYQIEYIEYGNIEVSTLENLFPCPSDVDLQAMPTQVSMVKLSKTMELSAPAIAFIDTIKDEEELILTLPDGSKTAPSGSDVNLVIAKNRVNLNKKLVEMCTPEWKKIEERGGDVVETEAIMLSSVEYTTLPQSGCVIQVLDVTALSGGFISGYDTTDKRADDVFNQLSEKMADYCNSELGREAYLPKPEEMCIAQLPPYPQWFRAVFLELETGPGSKEGKVCYVDYGNLATIPVSLIRKMMPEFITGYPVMGLHMEIRGFPVEPSDEMLARAVAHMKIDDEGRGVLKVSNCVRQENDAYLVDAPELLKAMKG